MAFLGFDVMDPKDALKSAEKVLKIEDFDDIAA